MKVEIPAPVLGEDLAGAERELKEGVRLEETPLWLPVLFFPEPDLLDPSTT